nr:MAG TPA: hypothetical protein [Caudoviricetes sp.]
MVEIVPVKTLTVILLSELRQHIEHHKPILIDNNCRDCVKSSKLILRRFVIRRVASKDFTKAGNVKVAETVNQNSMTKELGLVHIERRSKDVHVHSRIEHRVDNHVLVALFGEGADSRRVVIAVHERQLIGHALNGGDNSFRIFSSNGRDGDGVHTAIENVTGKQVLHDEELIVVRARIHRIDDSGDKVSHAVPRQERLFKLLLRNSRLVELLIVHDVERSAHIGHDTLENFLLGNLRVELLNLCNIDEDFLNGLTVFKNAFLEERNGVRVHLRREHNAADAVNQSVQEFVLERRVIHDNCTNRANGFNVVYVSFGDIIAIIDRSVIADNIQNVRCGRGERPNLRLNRHKHLLLSRKQVVIFFRRFIFIGFIFRKFGVCRRIRGEKTVFVFLHHVLILFFVFVTLLLQLRVRHFVKRSHKVRNVFERIFIVGSGILTDNGLKLFTG